MTSTPTRPVDNVVIGTKDLQDRNINILAGTTVENKGKLILTEIFPSLQNMIFFSIDTLHESATLRLGLPGLRAPPGLSGFTNRSPVNLSLLPGDITWKIY